MFKLESIILKFTSQDFASPVDSGCMVGYLECSPVTDENMACGAVGEAAAAVYQADDRWIVEEVVRLEIEESPRGWQAIGKLQVNGSEIKSRF